MSRAHPYRIFLILAAIFIIPFIIAMLMFKGHIIFGRLLNHGELVKPPFAAKLLAIRNERGDFMTHHSKRKASGPLKPNGKWTLIYFHPGLCEAACKKASTI